jgi:hypothetical protein
VRPALGHDGRAQDPRPRLGRARLGHDPVPPLDGRDVRARSSIHGPRVAQQRRHAGEFWLGGGGRRGHFAGEIDLVTYVEIGAATSRGAM